MCMSIVYCVVLVLGLGFIQPTGAQDDLSDPIKCYSCFAPAIDNICANPVKQEYDVFKGMDVVECAYGVCIKWIYYFNGMLHVHRTCSAKVSGFRLIMASNVCRKERNNNGYLCMCGRNLCNTSSIIRGPAHILVIKLIFLCLIKEFASML
ncbi:hypothetical protein CHS0354_009797 [Potamilus streckersoni]|uniref:UPAR/Ly6 domain-containing protein qvr n=1 Tax=Potamilus streckersoni TaxID=2493646 RepID=A0AAE0SQF5_9BIVA|nr:hypothetical protein CHS0354_009797 [Potamilus streckersoni]